MRRRKSHNVKNLRQFSQHVKCSRIEVNLSESDILSAYNDYVSQRKSLELYRILLKFLKIDISDDPITPFFEFKKSYEESIRKKLSFNRSKSRFMIGTSLTHSFNTFLLLKLREKCRIKKYCDQECSKCRSHTTHLLDERILEINTLDIQNYLKSLKSKVFELETNEEISFNEINLESNFDIKNLTNLRREGNIYRLQNIRCSGISYTDKTTKVRIEEGIYSSKPTYDIILPNKPKSSFYLSEKVDNRTSSFWLKKALNYPKDSQLRKMYLQKAHTRNLNLTYSIKVEKEKVEKIDDPIEITQDLDTYYPDLEICQYLRKDYQSKKRMIRLNQDTIVDLKVEKKDIEISRTLINDSIELKKEVKGSPFDFLVDPLGTWKLWTSFISELEDSLNLKFDETVRDKLRELKNPIPYPTEIKKSKTNIDNWFRSFGLLRETFKTSKIRTKTVITDLKITDRLDFNKEVVKKLELYEILEAQNSKFSNLFKRAEISHNDTKRMKRIYSSREILIRLRDHFYLKHIEDLNSDNINRVKEIDEFIKSNPSKLEIDLFLTTFVNLGLLFPIYQLVVKLIKNENDDIEKANWINRIKDPDNYEFDFIPDSVIGKFYVDSLLDEISFFEKISNEKLKELSLKTKRALDRDFIIRNKKAQLELMKDIKIYPIFVGLIQRAH